MNVYLHVQIDAYIFTYSIVLLSQCVAVCCSGLQCVAVCCSVLQWVAVGCCGLQCVAVRDKTFQKVVIEVSRSVLHCTVLQCVAVRSRKFYMVVVDVAVCCSVSQCFAVWCSAA